MVSAAYGEAEPQSGLVANTDHFGPEASSIRMYIFEVFYSTVTLR